eukprot:363331-Chlamydomonas_euryale.AAC.11
MSPGHSFTHVPSHEHFSTVGPCKAVWVRLHAVRQETSRMRGKLNASSSNASSSSFRSLEKGLGNPNAQLSAAIQ